MNGWLGILLIALAAGGAILAATNARAQLWPPVVATLVLAIAGYAWQGRPALSAAPAKSIAAERGAAEALIAIRADMDQSFGQAKSWLNLADGFARDGNYRAAAGVIQGGLRQYPQNADLWSAYGLVLLLASDGDMTPPAKFAFDKARKLAPALPAHDYFEGMAALFDRNPGVTIEKWRSVIGRATPKARWRPAVESQLAGLEQLLQNGAAAQAGQ
jgi:cytochrome c-type biogenesis protein CcmH